MSDPILALRGLTRRFKSGPGQLVVLDSVDLNVQPGEIVGLVGPSGSGKSSLLHAAGLLEQPSGGDVVLAGTSGWEQDDVGRTGLRREHVGFVYQFHHLLPEFTAIENVALPALIAGRPVDQTNEEATRLLTALGLGARLEHRPSQLSGGEQQRVAIARALINRPLLILADEPTGNLDPDTSNTVFEALARLVRSEGTSAIIATHNYELTRFMDRVVGLSHGKLIELDKSRAIELQLATAPRSVRAPLELGDPAPRHYPWARFWAKHIDIALHTAVVGTLLSVLTTTVLNLGNLGADARSWIPLIAYFGAIFTFPLTDAVCVSASGSSLGRALFRFGVRKRNGTRPSFGLALSRAWTCLFFGQGIGVASLFTWWASYSNLLQFGASLWDRDAGTEIAHRGPTWWSWLALALFATTEVALTWLVLRSGSSAAL